MGQGGAWPVRGLVIGNPPAGMRGRTWEHDGRMTKPKPKPPASSVPQSRLGRLASLGIAAGELALGAAATGFKRMSQGQAPQFAASLLTGASAEKLAARLGRLRGAAMK